MLSSRRHLSPISLIFFTLASCTALQETSSDATQRITLSLSTNGNNIEFDQKALEVLFGRPISLSFENKANLGSEIDHNVVIITPGSEERFVHAMQEASYDLEVLKKHPDVVAISKVIRPGESTQITFVPKVKGFYIYICVMPGHGDVLGMKGLIHVK